MDADEVRKRLRAAIADKRQTATALSRKMGRSQGYLSDFLRNKKGTIAAAESAFLERTLGLPAGSLLVSTRGTTDFSPPASGLSSGLFRGLPLPDSRTPGTNRTEADTEELLAGFGVVVAQHVLDYGLHATTEDELQALVRAILKAFEAKRVVDAQTATMASRQIPPKSEGRKDQR